MKFSHYLALIAVVTFASEANCITLSKDPKSKEKDDVKDKELPKKKVKDDEKEDTKDEKKPKKKEKDDDKKDEKKKDDKEDKEEPKEDGKKKKDDKDEKDGEEEEKEHHTKPLKTDDYDTDKMPKKSTQNTDKDWATYKEKHNEGKKGVIDGSKDPCSKREQKNFYGAGTCKEDWECMGSRTCMYETGKKLGFCTGPSSCPQKDDPSENGTVKFEDQKDGVTVVNPSENFSYKTIPFAKCENCKK